jgi:hypothetical protein
LVPELAVLVEASELVEDCVFYGEFFSIHGNGLHNPQFLSDSGLLALLRSWDVPHIAVYPDLTLLETLDCA